ncbi:MAG: FAD-dependent monooxygenase [Chloroflexia bacterium]
MENQTTEVLIVGGGPTGLMCALLLARYGIKTILVEQHPGLSIHPRARGLNVRTMETLRAIGLESQVLAAGAALKNSRYMLFVETLAGREIRRIPDADLMPLGDDLEHITPCTWTQCAQDELEPILLSEAQQYGATVLFNTELVDFSQDVLGVVALMKNRITGETFTIQATYMVAADGTNSPIVAALNQPTTYIGSQGHYVNVYFRADLSDLVKDRWFGICFVENDDPEVNGSLFLAVNNTDKWLLNIPYLPEKNQKPQDFTKERCIDLVQRAVGLPSLEVDLLSVLPWEAAGQYVNSMQAGRVFIMGDAAHVMPPAGGFGLNTGIQDAHNLAWKLAMIFRGAANSHLLDTYNNERQPVAKSTVESAFRDFGAPDPGGPPGQWEGDGPPDSEEGDWAGPPEENEVNENGEQDWGGEFDLTSVLVPVLGYRYNSIAVPDAIPIPADGQLDLTGKPGTRAPHVWLERDGKRISTIDLFDGPFVLLAGPQGTAWCDAASRAGETRNFDVVAYTAGEGGKLVDPGNRWCEAYGVEPDGAVLVRPDGFVAWRAERASLDPYGVIEHVLARIAGAFGGQIF